MENILPNSLINSYNFRGWNISIMLSLKCDHPLSCEFPILFSTMKVKLGHKFSQRIHKFNIWILKCWSGTVYISKYFPIHKKKRWEIGIFEKLRLHFQIFPNSLKSLKIEILVPLPSYLVKVRVVFQSTMTCGVRGANLRLNYQFSRKNV